MACEGVAEGVNLCQILDTGLPGDLDQLLSQLDPHLAALRMGKYEVALEAGLVLFPQIGQEAMKGAVDRDLPLTRLWLPEFLAADLDLPALQVNISPLKIFKFSFPHSGMQKREVDRIEIRRTGIQ